MHRVYSYTFIWKDRDGKQRSLEEDVLPHDTGVKSVRLRAIKRGYPGHSGGRWNCFVDDMHRWLIGKKACPTKNCNIHKTGHFAPSE